MQKQQIFFPYGISNFEQAATEGYVLVDKTRFIERLEGNHKKLVAFLRPRRIGKSLFVSVLEYYYDLNRRHKFEKIFGKLYIGQHPTPLASAYHVLKMDFSGINTNTEKNSFNGFLEKVRSYLTKFMREYPGLVPISQQTDILSRDMPSAMMQHFFDAAAGAKIYLIIDEYDHFTNEILIRDLSEFKKSVSQDGYVRKFYEAVKEATQQGVVDRFFITGVSPITLDSLTSGFNVVSHLTHDLDFHDMMGFTEAETLNLLDMVLEDKSRLETVMGDMRMYYNGYKFHPLADHTLYNSNLALYFLDHFARYQSYPRQILDPNIMPDYGKLKKMFEMADWQSNLGVLETILEEGEIASDQIYQFSFERGFGRREFINFLYYMGNLTIAGENMAGYTVFKVPNAVIQEIYWHYYASVVQELADLPKEVDIVQPAVAAMAMGNPKPFFDLVEKSLCILSNRDFAKFDEKYVKLLIVAYAMQGAVFFIVPERETAAGGYADLGLYVRPNNRHRHHQYVLELKYLKQTEADLAEKTMADAKTQLRGYLSDPEIQAKDMLRGIAVVVTKDKVEWEFV